MHERHIFNPSTGHAFFTPKYFREREGERERERTREGERAVFSLKINPSYLLVRLTTPR